jgi:hypothetical protein
VFTSPRCRAALLPAAMSILAACSSASPAVDSTLLQPAAHVAPGITAKPSTAGYLRGDATGLHLWGRKAASVTFAALDANGKPLSGASAPNIAVSSGDENRVTIAPVRNAYGTFALQAKLTAGSSPCLACRVVRPGLVQLDVAVTPKNGAVRHFTVPLELSHKIVAISLNPMPNPSLGGSDAVLQYYDDNTKPSVIWDDVYEHNTTAITNVRGMAFGPDGSLYVANSGQYGYGGTVTMYANAVTDPSPEKTFTAPGMISPSDVALDTTGNMYVSDNGYENVTRFPVSGTPITLKSDWQAGSDVVGVAADSARGYLYVALSGAGEYNPPKKKNVGRLVVLPLDFGVHSKPVLSIDSKANNGVNQPYGLALDPNGQLFVVNDYVSIVQGPPGPGPVRSRLARYANGLSSPGVLPDATSSGQLKWSLSVASDSIGTIYVANDAPPNAKGNDGRISLLEYDGAFPNKSRSTEKINLSAGLPSAYDGYYFNIQGVAVYPSPLQN